MGLPAQGKDGEVLLQQKYLVKVNNRAAFRSSRAADTHGMHYALPELSIYHADVTITPCHGLA